MIPVSTQSADCLVLGAGIVGICTALHLQRRGRQVLLIDRQAPMAETSYGNAGLIQAEAVMPYACPQNVALMLRVLAGKETSARVHWPSLPTWISDISHTSRVKVAVSFTATHERWSDEPIIGNC